MTPECVSTYVSVGVSVWNLIPCLYGRDEPHRATNIYTINIQHPIRINHNVCMFMCVNVCGNVFILTFVLMFV